MIENDSHFNLDMLKLNRFEREKCIILVRSWNIEFNNFCNKWERQPMKGFIINQNVIKVSESLMYLVWSKIISKLFNAII